MGIQIPNSWARPEFELFLKEKVSELKKFKYDLVRGVTDTSVFKIINEDLEEATITECISMDVSRAFNRSDLLIDSATLQAFLTYRLSLYDMIDDQHMERLGQPTVLARFGEKKVRIADEIYRGIIFRLAKDLQLKGITDAELFAKRQYFETIEADRIRSSYDKKMPTPVETIRIQQRLAGNPSKLIVRMAGGDSNLEEAVSSLVNALTVLEDFIGFVDMEDFSRLKATLPLAIYYEEVGNFNLENIDMKSVLANTRVSKRVKAYVDKMLGRAKKGIYEIGRNASTLSMMYDQVKEFNRIFPESFVT